MGISEDQLDQEIELLKQNIYRFRGVGVYQEACERWQHWINAYQALKQKLQEII